MIRCVSCGEEYDDDEVIYTCEKCGSVLELVNDIDVSKDIFDGRKDNLWKFKECIPVDEKLFPLMKAELHFVNVIS